MREISQGVWREFSGFAQKVSLAACERRWEIGRGAQCRGPILLSSGTDYQVVLALAAAQPELAQALIPGLPVLRAEVVFVARHEQAQTVGDVLARRSRVALEVARLLAPNLGWDAEAIGRQVAAYDREAERWSPQELACGEARIERIRGCRIEGRVANSPT